MKFKLFILFLPIFIQAKDDLKQQSATNKEFISHLEQGKFEIVHPFQLRDKNERIGIDTKNYFLNADVHYQHVTFVIKSNTLIGGKLKLFLNLNDYLFFNDTKFTKLDGTGETLFNEKVENCYYQGTVNGDDTTFVTLSTCNGLRGVIAFENGTTFGLWPLDGGDRNRRNRPPHVLFRTSWKEGFSCGAITENFGAHGFKRKRRDISRQTKYIELAVLADNKLITDFGFNDSKIIQYLLEAVNIADFMIARDLNVRLSIVYAEFWKDAQRVDLQEDIGRTLNGVNEYISGHIYPIVKDASIMLTTGSFVGQDAISSMFSSICTARAVGLVKAIESSTVHQTAQLISHAIGHIIGLDHDSSDCLCPHQQKCVMNRQQSIIGSPFMWQFSKCSLARMQNVLESGHVQCLLNKPFQESRLHQCGNGVVDGDEECDCGPRSECFDPCCDPLTCTLRVHAQCASHQPCCHRCELRKSGTICRESRSICDVPEYCDGESGDCPPDGYLVDGIQCGINGNCWKGNCSDVEQQCKVLWGSDARAGEDACYNYNEKGLEYGNCGKNRNGEFKKCEKMNIKCGILHCRDGSAMPVNSKLNSFNFQFLNDGHHVQCKAITSPTVGLVPDGTSCNSGSICIDGTCLPLVQVSPPVHCPSNNLALQCSGHGDCTTTQKCICYDGWVGVACDTRLNISRRLVVTTPHSRESILSSLNGRTIETTTLLMILLSVGVFLLILLVCLLFFYRRRSSADYNAPTVIDKLDETFQDDGRAIKFGNMPSYRDEKRKFKKNKEVYNALHKINEVDERETVSLKSRESASIASVPHGAEAILLTDGREGGLLQNVRINRLYDSNPGGIYAESSVVPSPRSNRGTNSPAQSDFLIYRRKHHVQLDLNTGMDPDVNDILTLGSGGLRNGHSISSMSSRAGSTNLKLSSLQEMMKHIPTYSRNDEDDICSDPELRHVIDQFDKPDPLPLGDSRFVMETNDYMLDPPPASADSGHPASVYEPSRHSPTLFSDKFKLDIEPRTT